MRIIASVISFLITLPVCALEQIPTRLGLIGIKEKKGSKFSIVYMEQKLLTVEAMDAEHEAMFRFADKDIVLLRFLQGVNSHHDLLAFVWIDRNSDRITNTIPFPHDERAKPMQLLCWILEWSVIPNICHLGR